MSERERERERDRERESEREESAVVAGGVVLVRRGCCLLRVSPLTLFPMLKVYIITAPGSYTALRSVVVSRAAVTCLHWRVKCDEPPLVVGPREVRAGRDRERERRRLRAVVETERQRE